MADRRRGWRRREVIARHNDIRSQHGLHPLRAQARLSAAARFHARDMDRRGYFSHDTPGAAHGIPAMSWVTRIARFYSEPAGENIAYGQTSPAEVMAAWMNSPEHRANILRPEFRTIGVGYSPARRMWVTDFGY